MADSELPDCDTPAAVLAFAQCRRAAAQRAEIDVLEAALVWAAMHPEESVVEAPASGLVFGELAVPLGGRGRAAGRGVRADGVRRRPRHVHRRCAGPGRRRASSWRTA